LDTREFNGIVCLLEGFELRALKICRGCCKTSHAGGLMGGDGRDKST